MLLSDPDSGVHFPGHKFSGPGTNAITKILQDIMPVNHNDLVSANHDLDYELVRTASDEIKADLKAYNSYDNSVEGLTLSSAMYMKKLVTEVMHAMGRTQPLMGGKSDTLKDIDDKAFMELIKDVREKLPQQQQSEQEIVPQKHNLKRDWADWPGTPTTTHKLQKHHDKFMSKHPPNEDL